MLKADFASLKKDQKKMTPDLLLIELKTSSTHCFGMAASILDTWGNKTTLLTLIMKMFIQFQNLCAHHRFPDLINSRERLNRLC